ncbi:MAG: hypothetical protein JWN95_579 [Frankiales bacterium]|nr:hypothetical protein [Frankiales bacterium]
MVPVIAPDEPTVLADYRRRTRRSMRIWGAIVLVLVLLAIGAVRLAYSHGDITKVSKQSAAPVSAIPPAALASTLRLGWHTGDRAASGTPYADGIVVTWSAHTVSGRDARTGAVRWYYTRSDRQLCGVVQQDGSTIAIYRHDGNCDEVTGFVTGTGVAKWYRTLIDDGDLALSSASNVVLMVSATGVHAIDNAGGLDRWDFESPSGCLVDRALMGSAGVLISYHCGAQYHLALHQLTGDSMQWTIDSSAEAVPMTAGQFVSSADPASGALNVYTASKDGSATATPHGTLPSTIHGGLTKLPRSQAALEVGDNDGVQVIDVNGRLVALRNDTTVAWQLAVAGPVSQADDSLLAPIDSTRIALITGTTGAEAAIARLSPMTAPGDSAFAVGSGALLVGSDTSMFIPA